MPSHPAYTAEAKITRSSSAKILHLSVATAAEPKTLQTTGAPLPGREDEIKEPQFSCIATLTFFKRRQGAAPKKLEIAKELLPARD